MNLDTAHIVPPVVASVFFLARMAEVSTKREVVAGKKREGVTFLLFMLCGFLIIGGGIAEFFLRGSVLWWPTMAVGCACSLGSFAIRRAAIRALGKFWSLHVEMREGHEFVTAGPFAYARHPVYFSMILELLGIGLVLNAWFTLAAVSVIFTPTLIARVRIEERALLEQFGDAYKGYMQSVPAILPGIGARRKP